MNLDFDSLIVAEANILTSAKSDRLKLSSLGEIYYDCSQGILAKSEELLNLATTHVNSQDDTAIDESFELFLQGWLQKSVSVNFLSEYMYPKERKTYRERGVEVQEITPVEAQAGACRRASHVEAPTGLAAFVIDDSTIDAASIAHEENIVEWAECLVEVISLWGRPSYTFNQLVGLSNLSPGRVFLALFLEERFKLNRCSDFYGEIVVSI